jgi:hypothetical protein
MKTPVAVALIIMGGMMIFAPAIADHFARAQLVEVLASRDLSNATLTPDPMNSLYRFGCWVLGVAMIAVAVFTSRTTKA